MRERILKGSARILKKGGGCIEEGEGMLKTREDLRKGVQEASKRWETRNCQNRKVSRPKRGKTAEKGNF